MVGPRGTLPSQRIKGFTTRRFGGVVASAVHEIQRQLPSNLNSVSPACSCSLTSDRGGLGLWVEDLFGSGAPSQFVTAVKYQTWTVFVNLIGSE